MSCENGDRVCVCVSIFIRISFKQLVLGTKVGKNRKYRFSISVITQTVVLATLSPESQYTKLFNNYEHICRNRTIVRVL